MLDLQFQRRAEAHRLAEETNSQENNAEGAIAEEATAGQAKVKEASATKAPHESLRRKVPKRMKQM